MTDRCCEVVDSIDCEAPPGYGEPASKIVSCWGCGRDVCRSCSSIITYPWKGQRRHMRFCFYCQDERKVGRAAHDVRFIDDRHLEITADSAQLGRIKDMFYNRPFRWAASIRDERVVVAFPRPVADKSRFIYEAKKGLAKLGIRKDENVSKIKRRKQQTS